MRDVHLFIVPPGADCRKRLPTATPAMAGLRRRWHWRALVTVLAILAASRLAHAELKLCNMTESRIGVAIAYRSQEAKDWVTEGWWNVLSHGCEILLRQKLQGQFYYIHAIDYDRGGAWEGKDPRFTMCIADKSFTITGLADCAGRGYKAARFLEVDTGQAESFTIRLTEPAAPAAPPP